MRLAAQAACCAVAATHREDHNAPAVPPLFSRVSYAMTSILRKAFVLSASCALCVSVPAASAQSLPTVATSGNSVRTRADLEALVSEYERLIASPVYSDAMRENARARSNQILERLELGDFRLGDAVFLRVESEPSLPETVSVQSSPDGPIISLPVFGDIRLHGVLRSELEERISETLRQYIRDPVVRARGLMRLSVQGAVGQPGFYVVPAETLVSEALMAAGGPAQNAALDELRIERGPEVLFEGAELQEELRRGTTLDQLHLQAGDQLVLPAQEEGSSWVNNLGVVLGLATSITLILTRLGG